jgi:Tfp pilus assembly protein PilO
MSERDKKALGLLVVAVVVALVIEFGLPSPAGQPAAVSSISIDSAEKRLRRLQEVARQRPRVAADAEAAAKALTDEERGLLKAATPALASAEMQQLMQDLLRGQGISMQSSEFGAAKAAGDDYAQVPLSVAFNCSIDQWINFMSAIRNAPQILSTVDLVIAPGEPKTKLLQVRMVVAGYISSSLLPKPKGALGR